MQQLKIVHEKKLTSNKKNQKTEQSVEELKENIREVKGRGLATSRKIYRIQNSDSYYFQSERSDSIYYFVKFNPSVFEWCSCPDNSTRHVKCKHIFGLEYAIRFGTLNDIEKLPSEAKRYPVVKQSKSYEEDEYSF